MFAYIFIRTKDDDMIAKASFDKNVCIDLAYKDYKEQMDKYYEDGYYTPNDNVNTVVSKEEFTADMLKFGKAGNIFYKHGDFHYELVEQTDFEIKIRGRATDI